MTHPHHWLVNEQNNGICRKCGETKTFPGWREEDQVEQWRRSKNSAYSKPFDDDGIRPSDLSHFRTSNYEAM